MMENIRFALGILNNPEKSLTFLENMTLDEYLGKYLSLLFIGSVLAGVATALFGVVRAGYFDIFLDAKIDYFGVLNYSLGRGVSMFFLFLFSGTMLLFIASIFIRMFTKMNYISLLKILMYSATPLLLFGWMPFIGISMILWSVFLFISSSHSARS